MFSVLLYLLLPVAFVVHEVEELLTYRRFVGVQARRLSDMLPILRPLLHRFQWVSLRSLVVSAVVKLLLLCIGAALLAYDYPLFMLMATGGFLLHLLLHLVQSMLLRQYVPGLVTALLFVPFGYFYLLDTMRLYGDCGGVLVVVLGLVMVYMFNFVVLETSVWRCRRSGKGKEFDIE